MLPAERASSLGMEQTSRDRNYPSEPSSWTPFRFLVHRGQHHIPGILSNEMLSACVCSEQSTRWRGRPEGAHSCRLR